MVKCLQSSRRRTIPSEGYDVWPSYRYTADSALVSPVVDYINPFRPTIVEPDFSKDKRVSWTKMSWDEIKRIGDEEKKMLKAELRQQAWKDFRDIVGEGLGYIGMGLGDAAAAAAGAVVGAGKNVYDFYKGAYDKAWATKQKLDELSVMDDYLRKHG